MSMIILQNILETIPVKEFIGDKNTHIKQFVNFDGNNSDPSLIMWVNDKNLHRLGELKTGTIICSSIEGVQIRSTCNYIVVDNPRSAFRDILAQFFVRKPVLGISSTAQVHQNVKLGQNIFIGHNVIIEEDCVIGNNTFIDHHTVIKYGTIIGDNVQIGANNTIGGIGFGYEKDEDGKFQVIPHIGNIIIENNVDIGNNTCIDRAVMGSTHIGFNCKIDNLVHIAHGVVLKPNSVVIAHAMIGGSSIIGENAWIAPNAAVINKVSVGDNAVVGLAAVVIRDVEDGDVIVGNPGKSIKKK